MRLQAALLAGLLAGPAWAQESPAEAAAAAAGQLEAAAEALEAATGARDRVRALTETVLAFEAGLAALRDGLRRASLREQEIRQRFDAKSEELGALLAVMQRIGQSEGPVVLLHPSGALGTARAGMMLGDVTPALQAEADALRAELEEVAALRAVQDDAAQRLRDALSGVQSARTALSQAISDRRDLPRRFVEDPVRMAILLESSETLAAFASGLVDEAETGADPAPSLAALKGALPLPARGSLLRRFNEADAAGITRPGLILATAPGALVVSPTAATIRYRGPLLDYGNVAILEPARGVLIVLAGLAEVYGTVGEVVPPETPVGLMGGSDRFGRGNVTEGAFAGGAPRSETLYIEVRQDQRPVDPAEWFELTRE